jgi:two-component system, NtrC family, nitrogen regulation response regulator NtrX
LVESELFGHVKGAFSGATANKKGKFEIADGATLFLDEIGDMSPRVQAKMLRVLEEQRFEPVGSNTPVKVDVRVISATNKRLDDLIDNGNFRADLFYRLNVIPFQIPPLRERREDVPALVEHFNSKFSADYAKKPKIFADDAFDALRNYTWPGNVRELRNTIERVVIMIAKQKVGLKDLPEFGISEDLPSSSFRFPSFKAATDAYQREYILHKLSQHGGSVSKAAEEMGVDRSHLYRRMKNLGIQGK